MRWDDDGDFDDFDLGGDPEDDYDGDMGDEIDFEDGEEEESDEDVGMDDTSNGTYTLPSDLLLPSEEQLFGVQGLTTARGLDALAKAMGPVGPVVVQRILEGPQHCLSRGPVNYVAAHTRTHSGIDLHAWCKSGLTEALLILPPQSASAGSGLTAAASAPCPVDVVVGNSNMTWLSVFRLPPGASASSTEEPAAASSGGPGWLLLARAQLPCAHRSLAVSPCGRFIAAGGAAGMLAIFEYHSPESVPPSEPGVTQAKARKAPRGGDGGSRGRGRARGGNTKNPAPLPTPGKLVQVALLSLGSRAEGGRRVNSSVRFGRFAGAPRIIVTTQLDSMESFIFLLKVPKPAAAGASSMAAPRATANALADQLSVGALPPWKQDWSGGPPDEHMPNMKTRQICLVEQVGRGSFQVVARRYTAAIGPFNGALHCAQPSPPPPTVWRVPQLPRTVVPALLAQPQAHGAGATWAAEAPCAKPPTKRQRKAERARLAAAELASDGGDAGGGVREWLAVGGDHPVVYLIPSGDNYRSQSILWERLDLGDDSVTKWSRPGCQQCAWSNEGHHLAVTSTFFKAVFIFDTSGLTAPYASSRALSSIRHENIGVSPVLFAPWDSNLLVWAQARGHIFICDVRCPERSWQRISLPSPHRASRPQPGDDTREDEFHDACVKAGRITGLAASTRGDLLVATDSDSGRVLHLQLLRTWSRANHRMFPQAFKAAARAVVLGGRLPRKAADDSVVASLLPPTSPTLSSCALPSHAHSGDGALLLRGTRGGADTQDAERVMCGTGSHGDVSSSEFSLQDMPMEVLEEVVGRMALPLYQWADVKAGPADSAASLTGQPTFLSGSQLCCKYGAWRVAQQESPDKYEGGRRQWW